MTISVSVERYISVIYPLLSIRLHSRHSYLYLALPSIIFSIIFTLPTYFVVETKCEDQNQGLKETPMDINISQVKILLQDGWIGKYLFSHLDIQEWHRVWQLRLAVSVWVLHTSEDTDGTWSNVKLKFYRIQTRGQGWSGHHGGRVRRSSR